MRAAGGEKPGLGMGVRDGGRVARCARLHSRPNTRNRLSYLAAWVFLAAAASAAQQPCAVRGVVTDQSTGKPVAGARLFLMPHAQGQHASLLQRSNEQGAFCFGAVDRGNYTLRTQRAGFLDHTYGHGLILAVDANAELAPLAVKLTRQAVLSGTVVDGEGEPVQAAEVSVYRRTRSQDEFEQDEIDSQETDDRGVFRFAGLAPDTYYLGVAIHDNRSFEPGVPFLDAGGQPRQEGYAETFYSAAARFEDARPIVLQSGKDVSGLMLTMLKKQLRHLSGKVVGAREGAYIALRRPNGTNRGTPAGPDGRFYFAGLDAGPYSMELRVAGVIRGRRDFDLTNGDLDNVTITADQTAPAAFSLTVRFRTEGAGEPYHPPSYAFTFLQKASMDGGNVARQNPDGTAVFPNLTPDIYKVFVAGLADGFYVKRIALGGQTVADRTVDLRNGDPGGIEITLAPKTAKVTGRITGDALFSEAVTVVLAGEGGRIEEHATTDQNGEFQIEHAAPGKYRLFAVEGLDAERWNAELASALSAKSLVIELGDGESKKVELPLVRSPELAAAVK